MRPLTNAKEEFLQKVKSIDNVRCARIVYEPDLDKEVVAILKEEFTSEEATEFLNTLDLEYDNGYGIQQLFGVIWMKDGSWYERGEYDGAEWWQHKVCPDIPADCLAD